MYDSRMKVIFNAMLVAVIVGILVTSTSAVTTVYASNHRSGPDSSTSGGSKGSDTSGSSSSSSSSSSGPSESQSSGSGITLPPSGPAGGQSSGTSGSGPNPSGPLPSPPGQPQSLTTCPNGGQPDSSGKCPPITPPKTTCPPGKRDIGGKCEQILEPHPCPGVVGLTLGPCPPVHTCTNDIKPCLPRQCPDGHIVFGDTPCPPLPKECHVFNNGTRVFCVFHKTVVHKTVQQPTTYNDVNLFIVTTCTADKNNGVLSGNLAAMCDSTITMMHNDGLDAQLPQVDMYLKARGLLS
jgi:hypothetical protein